MHNLYTEFCGGGLLLSFMNIHIYLMNLLWKYIFSFKVLNIDLHREPETMPSPSAYQKGNVVSDQ